MEYVLNIVKREPNPDYKPKRNFGYDGPESDPWLNQRSLDVVLTEEELKVIKKACIEVM